MMKDGAVVIRKPKDVHEYSFTHPGLVAFGRTPTAQAGAANDLR
jgi:hypothetical protein